MSRNRLHISHPIVKEAQRGAALLYNRRRKAAQKFYQSAQWRKWRRIWLHDNPLCRMCDARGRNVQAADVDHIKPIAEGGAKLDFGNFQSLCKSCHSKKTRREQKRNANHA